MTGYKSKRAAALDEDGMYLVHHTAQEPMQKLWDTPSDAFNDWWNNDYDDSTNPYQKDTFAYWAWAGWQAALAQPAQNHSEDNLQMVKPAQEPDVVMHWESHTWTINNPPPKGSGDVNLYYAPPQRFWVGLTEKQIEVIEEKALTKQWAIRMTIAQLKECNA